MFKRKQSTTDYPIMFLMVDSTDPLVGKTGLSPTLTVSKNGGAFASATGAAVEVANGVYKWTPNATDRNTLGTAILHAAATGAVAVDVDIEILPYDVFDVIDANLTEINYDSSSVAGLNNTYNGTGYSDPNAPATQEQVGNIGVGGTGTRGFTVDGDNTATPILGVSFVGSVTSGTYATTQTDPSAYHEIADTGDAITIVYSGNVNVNEGFRQLTSVTFIGIVTGANDKIEIQLRNIDGATWETMETIKGQRSTNLANNTLSVIALPQHTADDGSVYIQLTCTGQSNPNLKTGMLVLNAVDLAQASDYADGRIWVKDGGSTGTTWGYDGIATRPVTWATALLLDAANGGAKRFQIAAGTTITPSASIAGYDISGTGWSLVCNTLNIGGANLYGCVSITGTASGSVPFFMDRCWVGAATLPPFACIETWFGLDSGVMTAASAGNYDFAAVYSKVAGSGAPELDFSGVVATTNIGFRGNHGGLNATFNAYCTVSIETDKGGSHTIVTGGGDVEVRGDIADLTITTSGTGTTRFTGTACDMAVSGTGGTVKLYGMAASFADTSTGSTVTDYTLRVGSEMGVSANGVSATAAAFFSGWLFVDPDNGDNANSGLDWSIAKETIAGALSAAVNGTTIKLAIGTYSGAVDLVTAAKVITLEGVHRGGCIITHDDGDTLKMLTGCTLRGLTINATSTAVDSDQAVDCTNQSQFLIEDCDLNGNFDGLYCSSSTDFTVSDCNITGRYDALNYSKALRFVFRDCYFYTDSTYNSGGQDTRGLLGTNGEEIGSFNNCRSYAFRNDATAFDTIGHLVTGASILSVNCRWESYGGSASGNFYGLKEGANGANITLTGGASKATLFISSGDEFDIVQSSGEFIDIGHSYTTSSGTIIKQPVQAADITTATLTKFSTVDTGETTPVDGSVAELSQGVAGGGGGDATEDKQDQILAAVASGKITSVGPVAEDGDATVVQGDDYLESKGNALAWTSDAWSGYLTETLTFYTEHKTDGTQFSVAAAIEDTAASTNRYRIYVPTLNKVATAAFLSGFKAYDMQVKSVDGSANEITLINAELTACDTIDD